MSAPSPDPEMEGEHPKCEVCGEPAPIQATLDFRRGKPRRVCVWCLAGAIQGATGFKMVNMLNRCVEARANAPALRAAAQQARRIMAAMELGLISE